jgi:uncharacterized protein (TIGR02246 family)
MRVMSAALAAAVLVTAPAQAAFAPGLEAAIDQSHSALAAVLNGDPSGYAALFADRDDVTLGNPFGPYAKGKADVVATVKRAAGNYRDGKVVGVDRVALYGDGKFAALVEVEHDSAKVGGRSDAATFSARVSSVYEFIDDKWRLVHRHADPITTPRPAESVLQK